MPLRDRLGPASLRQGYDAAAEGFRDLLLEARVAERPAAIRCGAQVLHEVLVQRGAKQRAILLLARGRRTPKPVIEFMTGQKKIGSALRMGAIARPAIVARMPDHPRSNRIELDVAAAGEEVGLAVDRRRAIASLPQGAGSPIGRVDVAHVAAAKRLHGARQTVGGLWRNQ